MKQGNMRLILSLVLILMPVGVSAADNPRASAADLAPPEEVVRLVDAAIVEMVTPGGPAAQDWENQGVDLIARLSAASGGIDATVTVSDTPGDRSVVHYGGGRIDSPDGLKTLMDVPGRTMPGEIAWQDVSELGDGLWMRTSGRLTRRGNALCGQGWETLTILAPADAPLNDDARLAIMVVRLMAERLGAMEMCVIAFELPDGSFEERSFLPDGRPLPKLDEQMKPVRLRPIADAGAILTP